MQLKNIIYHFRVRGTWAEGVHIAGIVNGFRSLGNSVYLVSPTGIDPTNQQPQFVGRRSAKRSVFSFLLHALADYLPQILFEVMEICYNLIAIPKLYRTIKNVKDNVDFIYERYAFFNLSGALISYWLKIPLILEVNEISGHKRLRKQTFVKLANMIENFVFHNASAIITVSDFLKSEIEKMVKTGPRIITIPNGVAKSWLENELNHEDRDNMRKKLGLEDNKIVCYVGGLMNWHNFDLLLHVIRDLQYIFPETVLMLIGEGLLFDYIQDVSKKLNLNNNSVILVGNVPHNEVPEYINMADTTIIPETNDYRSPIKMFEYMAMGKPVIAPRMPAIQAVITDGYDGILFEQGNIKSCVEALIRILSNKEDAEKMGRLAKRTIAEKFTWESHAKEILNLAEDISKNRTS